MAEKTPNRANANCNQVILDHFWNVTGPSDDRRYRSVQVIVRTLQRQIQTGHQDDLTYCLDRLVRGLTSTREYARHGFCVLLTQLLIVFPERIDLVELVENAEKSFEKFEKKSPPESVIAWTLFYSCLLKSGLITLDVEQKILSNMFETLYAIGCQRTYVELIICELMDMFFDIFDGDSDMFEKIVIEPIKNMDDHGNILFKAHLIILARKKSLDGENKFFQQFLNEKIITPNNQDYGKVTKLLKESTKYHPNIHPIIPNLLSIAKPTNRKNQEQFFQTVIDDIFKVNMEKTSLGFEIIPILLRLADDSASIQSILSPDVIRIMILTLSNKKHPLHNSAMNLGENLIKYSIEIQNDSGKQFEYAKCFIEKPGSINFDEISRSKILSGIMKNFNSDAIKKWISMLKEQMINHENLTATDFFRVKCLQQMAQLLKSYNGDIEFLKKYCRFLFFHAYFNVNHSQTKKKLFHHDDYKDILVEFKHSISDQLRQQFVNAFKMLFPHLCTLETTEAKLPRQIEIYSEFTSMINSLIQIDGIELAADQNVSLKKLKKIVDEINEKLSTIPDEKNDNKCLVFRLLYHHFILESMENVDEIISILPDFNECARRAFLPAKKRSTDEPIWSDVLVDLFISLITKSKHIKNVILMVFKHICPFITVTGIQSLVEAFSNDETFELHDSDDEEEEDEEEEEANDLEEEETPKMEMDDDSSGEDDDDDDNDDDDDLMEDDGEEVEEQFKMDVCQALGSAAGNRGDENSEEEEEETLSDSEMFKLDEKLAAVFRKKFGDKKRIIEKKNLVQSFKLRLLDLIRIVVEHYPKLNIGTIFSITSNLIEFLRFNHSSKNMFPVTNRCIQVLNQIAKCHPEIDEEKVSQEQFEKLLDSLLQLQSKCTNAKLHGTLISLTSWLVSLAKKHLSDQKFINERMEKALQDLFQRANNETKPRLFSVVLPQLVPAEEFQESCYFKILQKYSGDENVRIFRKRVAQELLVTLHPPSAATFVKKSIRKKKNEKKKLKKLKAQQKKKQLENKE